MSSPPTGMSSPARERTFYRYVDLGLGGMKNLDLPSKCRYRPRKKHLASRFRVPEGHTWSDFRALPEEDLLSVVEIDCVEGARTDTAVLLTMLFKRISFLLVFVLEEHTQECVRQVFDSLEALLGERFRSVFPLLLTDCGHEFQGSRGDRSAADAPGSTTASPPGPTRRARSRTATGYCGGSSRKGARSTGSRNVTRRFSQAT